MPFKTHARKRLKYTWTKTKRYSHSEHRVLTTPCPAGQGSCPAQTGARFKPTAHVQRRWKQELLQTNHSGELPPPQQPGSRPGACGLRHPRANPAMKHQEREPAAHCLRHSRAHRGGVTTPSGQDSPEPPPAPPPPLGSAMRGLRAAGLPRAHRRGGGSRTKRPVPLTLAGADEEISVGGDAAEGQVHHGPRVAGAGERGLPHGHGGGGCRGLGRGTSPAARRERRRQQRGK